MKHCSVAYFLFVYLNNFSDFMQKEIVTSIQFSGAFQLCYGWHIKYVKACQKSL